MLVKEGLSGEPTEVPVKEGHLKRCQSKRSPSGEPAEVPVKEGPYEDVPVKMGVFEDVLVKEGPSGEPEDVTVKQGEPGQDVPHDFPVQKGPIPAGGVPIKGTGEKLATPCSSMPQSVEQAVGDIVTEAEIWLELTSSAAEKNRKTIHKVKYSFII